MVPTVPAVPLQEGVDNLLAVGVLAVLRDDGSDSRAIRQHLNILLEVLVPPSAT